MSSKGGSMGIDFVPVCGEEILSVSKLSVNRSGNEVISDINLTITCGEFIGIVGPNGGGKSTLILTILGVLKPRTGNIKIYDHAPTSNLTLGKVGWVPQAATNIPQNLQITVKEFIQLGTLTRKSLFQLRKNVREKVLKIIETIGLEEYTNTRMANLSGGQRQRAAIGKALASNADLLLMDEPMVGVDRESRNSIMRLLDDLCHEQNKTIVMVSHDLASIKRTVHRMVYLEQKIRYDGPTNTFPDLSDLAELRGIEATHPGKGSNQNSKVDSDGIITIIIPNKLEGE
jgi:zinc transport system ATP-binding protein